MFRYKALWYKGWRESSVRFALSAAAIAGVCLLRVLCVKHFYADTVRETPWVSNYTQYIFWTIFGGGGRGLMQLSCLLLGLGGLQRDRKQGTLGFTLALPVSRTQLVLARAALGLMQVALLALIAPLLVWACSPLVHQSIPFAYCIGFMPLWLLGGMVTFGVTFLCSVVFPGEYTALVVGYMVYMFLLAGARLPRLRPYPLHVADFMSGRLGHMMTHASMQWSGDFALPMLAGYATAALLLVLAANVITARQD